MFLEFPVWFGSDLYSVLFPEQKVTLAMMLMGRLQQYDAIINGFYL